MTATPASTPARRRSDDSGGHRKAVLARTSANPSIGFVGIHSNGRPDQPVSQNETLAELFEAAGYETHRASGFRNRWLRTAHQIVGILSWRRTNVVVIASFSGPSFLISEFSVPLTRLTGKKAVLFLHGGNLPTFGSANRRRVERTLLAADAVFAPSPFLAQTFRDWGIDVHVVPNVLRLERYEYRRRSPIRPRIMWMRTFHEHYDPVSAVRAFAAIRAARPDATMTMAGADQGLLDETVAEADRLGVRDAITFPGYLDAAGKRAAFADHDVFLNTNLVDNMPVSVLEAGASGLVVVATAVGGIPALVRDGEDGVLVDAGDDAAMARTVLELLDDGDRAGRMSEGGRAMAERSGWPQVHEQWRQELELILPNRRVR
ncbi:MAG: glycosyltransferase family 4 protein [Actinomycetota bacterium]